jgi:pantothenate kinase
VQYLIYDMHIWAFTRIIPTMTTERHTSIERQRVLNTVARHIARLSADPVVRVGIDGVDGAGKTTFADELADILRTSGRPVIRASVDGFHNPKQLRYQRGRSSPNGYFEDSYNYAALKALLLDPLSPGGSGRYCVAVFDHSTDLPVSALEKEAETFISSAIRWNLSPSPRAVPLLGCFDLPSGGRGHLCLKMCQT